MPGLFSIQITNYHSGAEGALVVSYGDDTRRVRVELFKDESETLLREIEGITEFRLILSRIKTLITTE